MSYYVNIIEMGIEIPKRKVKKLMKELDEAFPYYRNQQHWCHDTLDGIGFTLEPVRTWKPEKQENGETVAVSTVVGNLMTLTTSDNWDGKWTTEIEKTLQIIAKYAESGGCFYLCGEDASLFGYHFDDHELIDVYGEINWTATNWGKKKEETT